jgi:ELWxxDGT repeat protein
MKKTIFTILLLIASSIIIAQSTEISNLNSSGDIDSPGLATAFSHNSNTMIFSVNHHSNYYLFASDGTNLTQLNQIIVRTSGNPEYIKVMNNVFYFFGNEHNGNTGYELWRSDGTASGTSIVKDINSGSASGIPGDIDFCIANNNIFFVATDGNGDRLWKSDGSEANTSVVKIIEQANSSDDIRHLYTFNNEAYFSGYTNSYGLELWKSDGTDAGTVIVKDINPGTVPRTPYGRNADPNHFFTFNNTLYFTAEKEGYGIELWKTDGTESGTTMVKDINSGSSSSNPNHFFIYNNEIYFTASTSSNGRELWKTNGTDAGTVMIKDIYPGTGNAINSTLPMFNIINNTLYFMAESTYNRLAIWQTDGTTSGTSEVIPVVLGNYSKVVTYHNKLYFSGYDATNGYEIWESDGTATGTHLLQDINAGTDNSSPLEFYIYNDNLFFTAYDVNSGREIWKLSTVADVSSFTKMNAINIYPNPASNNLIIHSISDSKYSITDINGKLMIEGILKEGKNTINISNLSKGNYLVIINKDAYQIVVK